MEAAEAEGQALKTALDQAAEAAVAVHSILEGLWCGEELRLKPLEDAAARMTSFGAGSSLATLRSLSLLCVLFT